MKILISMPKGGYGDRVALTSLVPAIEKRHPTAHIYMPSYKADLVIADPRFDIVSTNHNHYDVVFDVRIGKLLAHWKDWESKEFCRQVGLEWSEPRYYFTSKEYDDAPACDVALSSMASGIDRCYGQMEQVAHELRGCRVIQVDNGLQITDNQPKTTMREAAAIVSKAKVVLTVDTAFMHVAIAQRKPTIVVFGKLTGPKRQYLGGTGIATYTHQTPESIARKVLHELSTLA